MNRILKVVSVIPAVLVLVGVYCTPSYACEIEDAVTVIDVTIPRATVPEAIDDFGKPSAPNNAPDPSLKEADSSTFAYEGRLGDFAWLVIGIATILLIGGIVFLLRNNKER